MQPDEQDHTRLRRLAGEAEKILAQLSHLQVLDYLDTSASVRAAKPQFQVRQFVSTDWPNRSFKFASSFPPIDAHARSRPFASF